MANAETAGGSGTLGEPIDDQVCGHSDMTFTLLVPAKRDEERDLVAELWAESVGPVIRVDRFWEPPEVDRRKVRLYGNDTFCLVLAQVLGLELVSPADDWLFSVPAEALGRRIDRIDLRDARSIVFPRFVKPIVPKQFGAAVYPDHAALEEETRGLGGDTELLVSEIVSISAEARCFVLGESVETAACYEGDGDAAAAARFVTGLVHSVSVPRTLVVDVALVGDRWCVLEANATWGAGLNGCDPHGVVSCLLGSVATP
jgi:hypothetical protein